nr:hypothetical protein GCM10020093_045760 [Planobispora longispora]
MNAKALRIGIKRGWTEHTHLLKTRKELVGTLIGTVGVFAALTLWMGDSTIEGTGVSRITFMMVGFLAYTVFGTALMTLPMALVTDREEGTLLRLRAIPGGIPAYLAGRATTALCQIAVQSALIVATGVLLGGAPCPTTGPPWPGCCCWARSRRSRWARRSVPCCRAGTRWESRPCR